MSTNIKHLSIW